MKSVVWVWLALIVVLTSCTGGDQLPKEEKNLTVVYAYQNNVNQKHLKFVKQALSNHFPDYSFQYIDINAYSYYDDQMALHVHRYDYPGLETIGVTPDLIIEVVQGGSSRIFTQDYTYDLESVLRTTNIDLESFDQSYLNHIRAMSQDGSLRALPLTAQMYALGFTPDTIIAEQIADVQTWDDLIDLSQKVPIPSPYRFQSFWHPMVYQFGLRYWNGQDQIELNRESWTQVLDIIRQLNFTAKTDYFFTPLSTLDMLNGNYSGVALHPMPRINETDFDGPNRLHQLIAIGPSTTRTDDALKVLAYMTSHEFQLAQARQGIGSVLDLAEVRDQFGADNENYNDMQVEAFFALRSSDVPNAISKYDLADPKDLMGSVSRDIDIYAYIEPYILQLVKDKLESGGVVDTIQAQLITFEKYMLNKRVESY